jgi:hypothetical protein
MIIKKNKSPLKMKTEIKSLSLQNETHSKTACTMNRTKRFLSAKWRVKTLKINIWTLDIKIFSQTKRCRTPAPNKYQKLYRTTFRQFMTSMKVFKCSQTCCRHFTPSRFKSTLTDAKTKTQIALSMDSNITTCISSKVTESLTS